MEQILFSTLTQDKEILKALESMKFLSATPVQAQSIGPLMEGHDIAVQAPTGTGKTCAFGIPLINRIEPSDPSIQAVVLAPTRELALQISEVLKSLAKFKRLRITTIYGGEPIERQLAFLRKHPHIVVATPGRLIDHIDRGTITLKDIRMLVLDEADRMLDMGFRPDLNRILKHASKEHQTALFSATLSPEIMAIAQTYQQNPQIIKIAQASATVDTVKQYYRIVRRSGKNQELVELLRTEHPKRTLIFSNTKRMAERIVTHLKHEGYRATYLHGDLRQSQRNRVMDQYRSGKLDILVATDVAARGIDVDQINMVVNYDLPLETENYVHRIGRTGRADQTGVAHTFIYRMELGTLQELMRSTNAKITPQEALVKSSQALEVEPEAKPLKQVKKRRPPQNMHRKPAARRPKSKPKQSTSAE